MKLSKLKINPNNPQVFDDLSKLENSIRDFPKMMSIRKLVYDPKNMQVLGGNKRLICLQNLGFKEIPDNWTMSADELTEDEKKRFIIADNIGFGEWDQELLKEWDKEDLESWGLNIEWEEEIPEAVEDDYEIPDEIETDIVLGDLIEIGDHRLLCGDSTDTKLIDKVLNNSKIELLLTDPPYGIDYGGMLKGKGDGKGGADKNGWKSYDAPDWDKSKPGKGVLQYLCEISDNQIIWGGNYFTDDLPPTMGWLIWDKGQRDFSLADGEMAWTSFNNAMRIKDYARAKANKEVKNHPTQKPQKIIQWCFEYADRHSEEKPINILDCYLGSGSTMVASHQLKRKCYGMELDPKYCQVIIDRMINLDPDLEVKINGVEYINTDEK